MKKGQKRLSTAKSSRNGVTGVRRPRLNKKAKGLVRLVKGIESNADSARDAERQGRKSTGMTMGTKYIKNRHTSGAAMGAAAHKRRGGLSMAGFGDHKHPKQAAKAKVYGTKIVRVQKAIDNFSKPSKRTKNLSESHTGRYQKKMTTLKAKRKK